MFKNLRKQVRATSMRFVLSMTFAGIVVAAMLFVGLTLKQEFDRTLIRTISDSSNEIIEQVEINLDNYFYNMRDLSDLLVIKISGNSDFDPTALDSVIEPTIRMRSDVITIALFDEEGNHMSSTGDSELQSRERISGQEWYEKIKYDQEYIHISEPHVQNIYVGEYPWVISISRRVGFRQNNEYKEGILLIDMNFSVIEDLLASVNLAEKGYVFLVDATDNIVYHNQQQLLYAGIKEENLDGISSTYNDSFIQEGVEDRYISIRLLDNVNWKLVGVYYASDVHSSQERVADYIKWILIVGLLLFVSFSLYMSSRITKPIQELEQSMKLVEQGNFDVQLKISGEHEVVQLTKSYNVMIRRIRKLMDQIVVEQEAKRKSELNSLQAQINPHFLYNTLDSIIWMAEHEKHEDVILMTNSLASLFRISISKGQMVIPVKNEIVHAENYLTIQKMRYKDKFDFKFEIDEAIYDYEILKLILQPIIENAIYHGIRHMVDKGFICIRGYLKTDSLIFEVEDDGLGMTESILNDVLYGGSSTDKGGVGVNNVHDRIQLMYGKTYGLTIESEIEEGTKVIFKLPRNEVQV